MTKTTDTIPPLSKTCPLSTSRLEAPDFEALRTGRSIAPENAFHRVSRSHPCPARLEARSGASPRRSRLGGSEGWSPGR